MIVRRYTENRERIKNHREWHWSQLWLGPRDPIDAGIELNAAGRRWPSLITPDERRQANASVRSSVGSMGTAEPGRRMAAAASGLSTRRSGLSRRLLSPPVGQVTAVMAADLDREWSVGEISDRAALSPTTVRPVLGMFVRQGLAQSTGPRSGRFLLTADGLYLHAVREQSHDEAVGPWPPSAAAACHQLLDLPVVGSGRLVLFTPRMRSLVAVLASRLDRDLSIRELSDASDVALVTATLLVANLAGAGLVVIDHSQRPRRHQLTATGLYLYTLAQQRDAHCTSLPATFSVWHPPRSVDPAAVDTKAVDKLRQWLARQGGQATRYLIRQRGVAGATQSNVDRLLADYQHVHPGTVFIRTFGCRLHTVIVCTPEAGPASPPGQATTASPDIGDPRGDGRSWAT
jgi:hypothetical protein